MHANHNSVGALVDAAISGGMALVGLMVGTAFGVVRADPLGFVYAAATAFFGAFFMSLGAARGRRPAPPPS